MRSFPPYSLWIGHVGDARDTPSMLNSGIAAMIDLAINELPVPVHREMIYCRFPLVDGIGNPPWLLRLAIETTASLLKRQTETLVFCSGGMSRSPAIAAAALSVLTGHSPQECLSDLLGGPMDVATGIWKDISALFAPAVQGGPAVLK
jgi:hypothetical protein